MRKVMVEDEQLREILKELSDDLSSWLERTNSTNALFAYYTDSENVKVRRRFLAKEVIGDVKQQVEVLARGISIDLSAVDGRLLLPEASIVEWGAVFQNVFINAFNALMDSERKSIKVSSRIEGRNLEILVQDTGCGVDLKKSETLFEPFERKVAISPERRALGYGGMGLGLTIVRLIANNVGCRVSFVDPEKGFSTAFSIRWREGE
jgi:signal transduction histidine kinase